MNSDENPSPSDSESEDGRIHDEEDGQSDLIIAEGSSHTENTQQETASAEVKITN